MVEVLADDSAFASVEWLGDQEANVCIAPPFAQDRDQLPEAQQAVARELRLGEQWKNRGVARSERAPSITFGSLPSEFTAIMRVAEM